jgi:mannose-1-phosphate guanylyltransferase/mannose-6-phosphate isomerase
MTAHIVPAILSGGAGSRLWPLSRADRPKQFLTLYGGQSLLGAALQRCSGDDGAAFHEPIIIANQSHQALIEQELRDQGVQSSLVIYEPSARNTAPAAAAAALAAAERHGDDALVLVAPADHRVEDVVAFRRAVASGAALAEDGRVVTLGITPDSPSPSYGYIKRGDRLSEQGFSIAAFKEKPDSATAAAWLDEGGWLWNAGLFLFRARDALHAMERLCPDIVEPVRRAYREAERSDGEIALEAKAFGEAPACPFDVAVMERIDRAAVVPVSCGWDDLGAYEALWRTGADREGAVVSSGSGRVVAAGAKRIFAHSDQVTVVAAGVEELVIVATPEVVLVAPLSDPAAIKEIRGRLEELGLTHLL